MCPEHRRPGRRRAPRHPIRFAVAALLATGLLVALAVVAAGCHREPQAARTLGAPATVTTTATVTVPPPPPPRAAPTVQLNVKDFGAKGDWATDDTAAIQSALDAVPPSGGVVFFPAGGYLVPNGGLVSNHTVTLLGVRGLDGSGSRIQVTAADNAVGLQLNGEGSVLDSMEVTRLQTSPSPTLVGVVMNNNFSQVIGSRVSGFGVNLRISGTFYTVNYSSFRDFFHAGVEIDNPAAQGDAGDGTITASTFERGTATAPGGSAVHWISGGGLRFVDNKINGEKTMDNGIFFEPGPGVVTSVLIVNSNSIENFNGAGILMVNGAGHIRNSLVISDNELASYDEADQSCGISIDESVTSVTISGNSIYATGTGITLQSVQNATVTGNALAKVRHDGIIVGNKTTNVTVAPQAIEVLDGRAVVHQQ